MSSSRVPLEVMINRLAGNQLAIPCFFFWRNGFIVGCASGPAVEDGILPSRHAVRDTFKWHVCGVEVCGPMYRHMLGISKWKFNTLKVDILSGHLEPRIDLRKDRASYHCFAFPVSLYRRCLAMLLFCTALPSTGLHRLSQRLLLPPAPSWPVLDRPTQSWPGQPSAAPHRPGLPRPSRRCPVLPRPAPPWPVLPHPSRPMRPAPGGLAPHRPQTAGGTHPSEERQTPTRPAAQQEHADAWLNWLYEFVAEDLATSEVPKMPLDDETGVPTTFVDLAIVGSTSADPSLRSTRYLAPGKMEELYEYYVATSPNGCASRSTFLLTFRSRWRKALAFRTVTEHAKCTLCALFAKSRQLAQTAEQKQVARAAHAAHISGMYADRAVYGRLQTLSAESTKFTGMVEKAPHPSSVLCLSIDGMDQA